jgi:dihydroorotate dehydrogenase (NAD+) catalytic subunit
MADLRVNLAGLDLANPIMHGSGTFSAEVGQVIDINRLGAMVAKTVSRNFRSGNPPPRVAEVEGGMINSIGLPTKGLGYFLETQLAEYKQYTPPLICSISAETAEDFADMAADVSVAGVDAIELNISCPTRKPGGGNFALNEEHTHKVVAMCRARTDKMIIAKLSPNAGDVVGVAEAAEAGGANALTVANTILGLKIDVNRRRPAIGQKLGGLSGPGIKPIIMRMVYQCAKAVKIPIIGVGGITKVEDVVEYMLAGATAVQVGYATFRNPTVVMALIDGLAHWCDTNGVARAADLTGAMIDDAPLDTYVAASAPIG